MVIGALWYSPVLFGKAWMKLKGISKKDIEKAKQKGMAKSYITMFVALLVMYTVLDYIIVISGATTIMAGATIGFIIWLGFIATVMLNTVLWDNQPMKLYMINVLHYLVVLLIAGAILAVW